MTRKSFIASFTALLMSLAFWKKKSRVYRPHKYKLTGFHNSGEYNITNVFVNGIEVEIPVPENPKTYIHVNAGSEITVEVEEQKGMSITFPTWII